MKNLARLLFSCLLLLWAQPGISETTETTYYIPDASGSPIAAMDEAGNIKWRKHYRPFGEEIEQDAASKDNRIGYTGHVHDRSTGLTYMGARYYDPAIGRFMSMDPAPVNPEDPMSFNRFVYANNNPYKYVDPDGKNAALAACAAGPVGCAIGVGITLYAGYYAIQGTQKALNESSGDDVRGDNVRSTDDPVDLEEDLAGQEILGDLANGGGDNISDKMGDPRYGPDGTQDKVRGSHSHGDGTVTEVHADRNRKTGELSDTKFKTGTDNKKSR